MKAIKRVFEKCRWILYVAHHLSADAFQYRKILMGGIWLLMLDTWRHSFHFEAKLTQYGRTFPFHFEDISEFGTLWEVFGQEIYRLSLSEPPSSIFDLGSNIGASAIYFRLRYPKAKIYCFEPDSDNYRRLKKNTSRWSNLFTFPFAVWSKNGTIDFYVDPHTGNSSSCTFRRDRQLKVEVTSRSLDTIINEYGKDGVDLLKFDVEGAEFEIFESFHQIQKVKTVIGELHTDLSGSLTKFIHLFSKHHDVNCTPIAEQRYTIMAVRKESSMVID